MLKYAITAATLALTATGLSALDAHAEPNAIEAEGLSKKAQATLDRFEPTGTTINCLSVRKIRTIKALSDDLFLVRVGRKNFYLNKPTRECTRASRSDTAITYKIDGAPNLCRGEIVTVVTNRTTSIATGSCALGEFVELREKDAE